MVTLYYLLKISVQFSSVQLLSHVRLFAALWIAACQASLSITISRSSLRLTSIESMMPSSHLILGHPLQEGKANLFPSRWELGCDWKAEVSRDPFPWYRQKVKVAQSCPTLCDPMNHSTPGLPVHHQLPEFTQTHVHRVHDAIQPSHPWSSPFPPAPNPSQHQSLFQWVNSLHDVAKTLEIQL